jgi:two-component system nitrogen regulation response regulator NtrX
VKRPILIVDDDDDIRSALAMILDDEGYPTDVAPDGVIALEHLRSHRAPAMILLDLMMPRLDGEAMLLELRSDPSLAEIPVVVLSGHKLSSDRLSRMRADDFLLKPVDLDDVLTVVERYAGPPA